MPNPTPFATSVVATCKHCGHLVRKHLTGFWRRPLVDADLPVDREGQKMPGWCLARSGPFSTNPDWSNHEPLVLEREALEAWLAS